MDWNSILQNLDKAGSVELAATLAGLSLTAITFFLMMNTLCSSVIAKAANDEKTELQQEATGLRRQIREGANYLIKALYGFLVALLIGLGIDPILYEGDDSVISYRSIEYGAEEIIAQSADIAVYTIPFCIGVWFLFRTTIILGKTAKQFNLVIR